jgi:thiosulfate reductase cytochrome b subunit
MKAMSMRGGWRRWVGAGLAAAGLLLALAAGQAGAWAGPTAPQPQASPLHPAFALLDAAGENVLVLGGPVSARQTCGQCHDTDYIEQHNLHAGRTGPEAFEAWAVPAVAGAWDPLNYLYEADGTAPGSADADCFLCHLAQPDNASRLKAMTSGRRAWASTALLAATGIVTRTELGWGWNLDAFDRDGLLKPEFVTVQDPANANCAQCHGDAHTAGSGFATTGQVYAAERLSESGANLPDKAALTRAWDAHAERGLQCTDCHFALNNPAHANQTRTDSPDYLSYDPRGLEVGEFLQQPDHQLALSASAPAGLATCAACHDAAAAHTSLPYEERHFSALACETCHSPRLYAPAVQSTDWTVLTTAGEPRGEWRGVETEPDGALAGTSQALVPGYEPLLLPAAAADGQTVMAPFNLVTVWYWVYDDQGQSRPVPLDDLKAVLLTANGYAPEVATALDADGDGQVEEAELVLDTPEKQAVIAGRLSARGLAGARIEGAVRPYAISHGVAGGEWAIADCAECHTDDSRLSRAMLLAAAGPAGVTPGWVSAYGAVNSGKIVTDAAGAVYYQPSTDEAGVYVFGHDRVGWVDGLGLAAFVAVLLGVTAHGGLRFYAALRQPQSAPRLKRVYMYAVYERFWHWLQTAAIMLLLLTGLVIHRPDVFAWFNFNAVVIVHNVLAVVLVVNAALSLFYHLVSGEIRQYLPRPYGFFDQAIVQAKFYLRGIFRRESHPFEKTPQKKLNPLQQVTYFGILNVLLPLQVLTGGLMWGAQRWPEWAAALGGLAGLASFHSLVAWLFAAFIVAHVYLTTTGHTALASLRAMMNGWDEVETHAERLPEAAPQPQTISTPMVLADEEALIHDDIDDHAGREAPQPGVSAGAAD